MSYNPRDLNDYSRSPAPPAPPPKKFVMGEKEKSPTAPTERPKDGGFFWGLVFGALFF